jgi:4'-phosphopantetheinyl transferase
MADVIAWGSPERQPQLTKDEVHIWRAKLDLDSISVERFSADLSPDEKTRATRFVLLKDRRRFTVARSILRQLLGGYLRQSSASVKIETGPHGKPNLKVGPDSIPLRFNLSHAHELVLYAFSLQGEVGIDVEQIRPRVANEGIEDRYFTSQEQKELEVLPPDLRPEGFFSCWTRKEAYVKACGEGLQIPLTSFDVSLTPGQPATLNRVDKDRWSLYSFYPEPGFVAAMVIEGQGRRLRFWEWRDSSNETLD